MSDRGWALIDTLIGICGIAWEEGQITRFRLPEKNQSALESILEQSGPSAEVPPFVQEIIARVKLHLNGNLQDFSGVPVKLDGLPSFHRRVYREALKIPAGQILTYGEIAARAGSPGASRAVGQAMGRNPIPLIVPCHRVVAANGAGGFSAHGGLSTKARLLQIEGVNLLSPEPTVGLTR